MQQFLISCLCILCMVFIKAVEAGQDMCTESKCSGDHGLAIHFPFRIGHHCGEPGLDCNGRQKKVPEQRVALVKFFVKSIDYKRGLIEVYNKPSCLLLKPLETPNIPISPFHLLDSDIRNVTLFHCPTLAERDIYAYQVPCLSGSPGYKVYGFSSFFQLFDHFPALQSCTRMYDVLSVPFRTQVGGDRTIVRFKWSEPNCTECEAEGKRCRLNKNGNKTEVECIHLRKASKTMEFIATGATLGSSLLLVPVIAVYRVYSAKILLTRKCTRRWIV